jgi:hypothetical protein
MNYKHIRNQPSFSITADEDASSDFWLKQIQKNLDKTAVQSKNLDDDLFNQINSIMNNKSKYPSVEAAVQDMKERSGLSAFLKNVKISETDISGAHEKIASDNNDVMLKKVPIEKTLPSIFEKCPTIQSTFDNVITDTNGNLSIPAIIDRVRTIHQHDVSNAKDWDCDDLISYVGNRNLQEKSKNPVSADPQNLGSRSHMFNNEIDDANTDAFKSLTPATF